MRFIKDYDKIYFDNAKMGPIYSELHDWRISYEKKLLEKKSILRDNHEFFFKELKPVSYTHLRAHETPEHRVCRGLR